MRAMACVLSNCNMPDSPSLKRKLDDHHDPHKKPRTSLSVTITLKPQNKKPFASAPIPMPNACPDYPNGFIYCHQCSKKRDVTDAIQCTFFEVPPPKEKDPEKDKPKEKTKEKAPRQRRCVAKYCKFCLKNRYDVEFDDVVNAARNAIYEPGHIDSAGYFYRCPKCADTCNCPRCRKSKGLEPMGSAGTIRHPPPEPAPKPSASKSKADRQSKKQANGDSASTAKGAKGPKKPKPKPLPLVEWTPVPVHLSLYDAEARFHIREFVLRFADLFEPSLPRTNLEELEDVGGGRHQGRDENDDLVSWVSDFCVKSIIVGLLNLLAKELQGPLSPAIKNAVKEIRNLGVNLNKIWPVLATLRDSPPPPDPLLFPSPHSTLPGSSSPFTFTFPDPLSPPSSLDIRTIRSTRTNASNDGYGIHIAYSAQMVPVVEALIGDVLMTTAVREELEEGMREGMKEMIREQKEAVKRETERWDVVRKSMETRVKLKAQILENRAKREYHKLKVISLENSLKTLIPKYAARFTPLGTDNEDRVYWILSPGVSEREAAQDFIMSCSSDDKLIKSNRKKIVTKKARVLNMEERVEMRSWSWFLAVWGKRPEDAVVGNGGKERGAKVKAKSVEATTTNVKLKIKVNNNNGNVRKESDMDVDQETGSSSEEDDDGDGGRRGAGSQSDVEDGDERDDDDRHSRTSSSSSSSEEDDEEEEDKDREGWWGFYDPLEILKLSEWISMKAGLDDESKGSNAPTTITVPLSSSLHSLHPLPQQKFQDELQQQQQSRASSSTITLNGGTITPSFTNGSSSSSSHLNGISSGGTYTDHPHPHHYLSATANGGIARKSSRDTSVNTVVDSYTQASSLIPTRGGGGDERVRLKNLVEELRTFAVSLEWRCREDKYEGVLKDLEAAAGGAHNLGTSVVGSRSGSIGMDGVVAGGKGKAKAMEMEVDEVKEEEKDDDGDDGDSEDGGDHEDQVRSERDDESESGSGSESGSSDWNSREDEDISMA